MDRCAKCNKILFINRFKDGDQRYCSLECLTTNETGYFCEKCIAETTNQSPGNTVLVNYTIGTYLVGSSNRCPICHSVIQTKKFMLIPSGRYRMLYVGPNRYVGRKLR